MAKCKGGDEVGIDWFSNLVLHENDDEWHVMYPEDES